MYRICGLEQVVKGDLDMVHMNIKYAVHKASIAPASNMLIATSR